VINKRKHALLQRCENFQYKIIALCYVIYNDIAEILLKVAKKSTMLTPNPIAMNNQNTRVHWGSVNFDVFVVNENKYGVNYERLSNVSHKQKLKYMSSVFIGCSTFHSRNRVFSNESIPLSLKWVWNNP
jgi:hypothetical protein